jgi:hypothetical protein
MRVEYGKDSEERSAMLYWSLTSLMTSLVGDDFVFFCFVWFLYWLQHSKTFPVCQNASQALKIIDAPAERKKFRHVERCVLPVQIVAHRHESLVWVIFSRIFY